MTEHPDGAVRAPLVDVERALIDAFLRSRGYDAASIALLNDTDREQLLKEASIYASSRLSEIESRAHFLDELHDRDATPHA
jgi:hypothetical protein